MWIDQVGSVGGNVVDGLKDEVNGAINVKDFRWKRLG